jgi:hypothetical protein
MRKLLSCVVLGLALMVFVYAQTWYQVLEVKSTASKQTDVFETKGTKWRIRWQKPTAEDHLTVYVYDKNGDPIEIVSTNKATQDESYLHKPGTFYLKINAGCAYTITVEDWR